MKWRVTVALGFYCLLALILRLPDLDQRPFHNDEAVNAIKFRELLQDDHYRYDPHEYHGPLLHYGTLVLARLTGWMSFADTTEASFRSLTVVVGLALIPMLWLIRDALGRAGMLWAGLLTALSPSLTFYNRDYIHESLLVTGTFLLTGALWRYCRKPGWQWAVMAGIAIAWMHTTKETFVINLLAMALSFGLVTLWRRFEASDRISWFPGKPWHWVIGLIVWLLIAAALFSSFGNNPAGPLDSMRTYLPWMTRAGAESEHTHAFWFYGKRLFWQPSGGWLPWTELGVLVFALIGGGAAFLRREIGGAHVGFIRWLGMYTGLLFLIYSVIPYKTPWCILSVSHGLVLLAGVGLAWVWRATYRCRSRLALAGVTLLLLAQVGWQSWALSHSNVTARSNPWAYADTSPDIANLLDRISDLSLQHPDGEAMNIQVACEAGDYWPLPYYLRNYSRVGWWSDLPPSPLAPVLVVSPEFLKSRRLQDTHVSTGMFEFRRGVFRGILVERGFWEAFLKSRESGGL